MTRTRKPVRSKALRLPPITFEMAGRLLRELKGALVSAGVGPATGPTWFVSAGSYRRLRPTVGDLDVLLVDRTDAQWAMLERTPNLALTAYGSVKAQGAFRHGKARAQVDLRRVESAALGAALDYFTGPRGHNLGMRAKAKAKGFKLNEYGLFRLSDGRRVAGRTEQEIYDKLGHRWKPPEERGR